MTTDAVSIPAQHLIEAGPFRANSRAQVTDVTTGTVSCDYCDGRHRADFDHMGRFGEGPLYGVVCDARDENGHGPAAVIIDYYTRERVTA